MKPSNIIPNKRAETFVGCDINKSTPNITVQVSDLTDYSPEEYADNYVNIIVDIGDDRLRLKVHEDGTWTLDNYDPEEVDATAWADKISVAAGDVHKGTVYSRNADRAVVSEGYRR